MNILALTNLFPPHHADSDDFRCQNTVEALRARGHMVRVLTSTVGMVNAGHTAVEMRRDGHDALVQRRLRLNGVYGQPAVSGVSDLRELEARNNEMLREAMRVFAPDVVQVRSLHGLSKSLLLTLRRTRVPVCFDVADPWLAEELRTDPWLAWWHSEKLSTLQKMQRTGLEVSGQRLKWDAVTPTFIEANTPRLPQIFDAQPDSRFKPNSITALPFRRLYFSSAALHTATAEAGFRVAHGEVIHPGVDTRLFHGEVKPPGSQPIKKFLIVARLTPHCGVGTALEALQLVRAQGAKATLTICGRGNSEVQARLRTQAAQRNISVEFRPGGTQRELPLIYQSHDAFIYPVEREESWVGAPLEAMAAGLPVIMNDDHGARELFQSSDSYLSFPSGDAGLLANRMLELIREPQLAHDTAAIGQNEILSRFQFSTTVEQIDRYLDDTVAQWNEG